jgi:hypothetical protein
MRARFLIWCLALQAVSCVGTGGGTPNDDLLRSCRMDRSAGGPWAPWARDVWKGRYPPKLPATIAPLGVSVRSYSCMVLSRRVYLTFNPIPKDFVWAHNNSM